MKNPQNIEELCQLPIDYMGLIFYQKSPRNVEGVERFQSVRHLNPIKRVGVFVNAEMDFMINKVNQYGLKALQLHGQETPNFIKKIKSQLPNIEIIKVFSAHTDFDFEKVKPYESLVDYFLFDTKGKNPGGNGVAFDWSILNNYKGSTPFFLSGGITPNDAKLIQQVEHEQLFAIDINSKFEDAPGLKNIEKIKTFIHELRSE